MGKNIKKLHGSWIASIQTNHGSDFHQNVQFGDFCDKYGISHNFRYYCSPQNNEVVERKIWSLQEMCCIMLNEQSISQKFWCHVIETASFILNRASITRNINKTPYEILRGKNPFLGYFKVFGCRCVISKTYKGIFLGYSPTSKAYIIFNKETLKILETINVSFNENIPSPLEDKLG